MRIDRRDGADEGDGVMHDETLKKLDSLGNLQPNWDSYDAQQISKASIIRAKEFLALLPAMPPPHVVPVQCGHVALEWHIGNVDIDIDFISNGGIVLFFMKDDHLFLGKVVKALKCLLE